MNASDEYSVRGIPASVSAAGGILTAILIIAWFFGIGAETIPVTILLLAGLVVLLIAYSLRKRIPRSSAFIMAFLPIAIYGAIYPPIHNILYLLNPSVTDQTLTSIDQWLFRFEPIGALGNIAHPFLTDIAYLGYFSYYLGMPVLLILMFLRAPQRDFEKVLFVMTIGWYGALISYLLFPALGPARYPGVALPELHGWLPTTMWIQEFLSANLTPTIRDCVPSMHTAITILTLMYAHIYQKRFFRFYLIPGILLIFATMYLQQHYVIDVLLGGCTAGILFTLTEYCYSPKRHCIPGLQHEHDTA